VVKQGEMEVLHREEGKKRLDLGTAMSWFRKKAETKSRTALGKSRPPVMGSWGENEGRNRPERKGTRNQPTLLKVRGDLWYDGNLSSVRGERESVSKLGLN